MRVPRHFSDFLAAYVETFAPKGEAPERFQFWCAVHTVAGVLRRRVYIDEGTFRWYPNFYILLIGPPGTVKKSSTINVGARLLREVPGIQVGSDCTTWEAFVQEVADSKDMFADGDPLSGVDPENLINLEQTHNVTCAVSFQLSEFGTFFNPRVPEMVNVLTELYDCKVDQAFRKATKTQGTDTLMNPFVNIIAGTTPTWMDDNFRGQFGGWGLSSRCIFMHASQPDRHIAYPHKMWKGSFDSALNDFLDDLKEIARLQGTFTLTPDAEGIGEAWYSAHMDRKVALDSHPSHDPWLSYYLARKWDHVHKLAMVTSACRRSDLRITESDLRYAITRCDEVEQELSQIFADRGGSSDREAKLREDVWNGISYALFKHSGRVPEYALYGYTQRWMSFGRAKELLNQLLASQFLTREQDRAEVFYTFGAQAQVNERKMLDLGVPMELLTLLQSRRQQEHQAARLSPQSYEHDE